jgi:hypothetical protein
MSTLHVFLDESGDMGFTPAGSRYYIFAVLWTYTPEPLRDGLDRLRHELVAGGEDIARFHASEDRHHVRARVANELVTHGGWRYAAMLVDKPKVNPNLREEVIFYPKFAAMMLRFVMKGRVAPHTTRICVSTDRMPVKKNRVAVTEAIAASCRLDLNRELPIELLHLNSADEPMLQGVDYCAWGVQRRWSHGRERLYRTLEPRLATRELDCLHVGELFHYLPSRGPEPPPTAFLSAPSAATLVPFAAVWRDFEQGPEIAAG